MLSNEVKFQKKVNFMPNLCRSSNLVSGTGGLTMRNRDNIFIVPHAIEIGSVLCGRIMKKSTKEYLNANWCNSSTSKEEEEK